MRRDESLLAVQLHSARPRGKSGESPALSRNGVPPPVAAVTVSIDEMVFLVPVRVGDVLHLHAQVNWAGSTSMEVGVRAMADRWDRSVPPVHVASAYVVLVAVDEDGAPRPVPPVVPETDDDRRRFGEAQIRRTHRLARRAAIVNSRLRPA